MESAHRIKELAVIKEQSGFSVGTKGKRKKAG
jgi:hypothetical protein